MQFVDGETESETMPNWAEFLVRFGYSWCLANLNQRRIAVVSMPCDSAASGLLALGAMIRDLESPGANNRERHYDSLLRFARQYLESCKYCEFDPCDPESKSCGYLKRADGILKKDDHPTVNYEISDQTDYEKRSLTVIPTNKRTMTWRPTPEFALNWHVRGEPQLHAATAEGVLPETPYRRILGSDSIISENLSTSYSGICFAGRTTGTVQSKNICEEIWFSEMGEDYNLAELLTVQGWSAQRISRMALFNPRTGRMDHGAHLPRLVIADGDGSFHSVASRPDFQQSDIIGVIDRTVERERLEAVGAKIDSLSQWYEFDEEFISRVPEIPRGISVVVMKRK